MKNYEFFMKEALIEAKKALKSGGYGIGAVLVLDDEIIARTNATTHITRDPTIHAETQLIDMIKGTKFYTPENRRKMTIYTTLEQCPMCYCTILIAKIGKIVFGMKDSESGFTPSPEVIPPIFRNQMPKVVGNILEEECGDVFLTNREDLDKKYLNDSLFQK